MYIEEPIIIKEVNVPRQSLAIDIGLPMILTAWAGTVASAFLPFAKVAIEGDGVSCLESLSAWDLCEASMMGFLFKYLFLVFALVVLGAIWKKNSSVMLVCAGYWVVNLLVAISNSQQASEMALEIAKVNTYIGDVEVVCTKSLSVGFCTFLISTILFVVGSIFYKKEHIDD